ncbi:MAG: alkaline phosphatase family protein [Acidobacteria bacterium]|nr:alkaline phosphatase family protein [Acidobacteriota bacterium]
MTKSPVLRWSAALIVSAAVAASATLRSAPQTPAAPDRTAHVVLITLDGFPALALDDPTNAVPTLRKLAARGAIAKRLRPIDPTVTWPNHTAMVTGVHPDRHRVLYNGLLVREPGMPPRTEPWRDKADMVKAPTVYDVAHAAGLTTAQVDWVALWNAPTITWEFRERPSLNESIPREMVQAGALTADDVAQFGTRSIVWRDEIWTQAAEHILRTHRPNLLLFHLLTLDSTHHRYGPGTLAAQAAMAHLDDQVARIVKAVDESGLSERTTFIIASDHGFKRVKRQVRPNAALAQAGLIGAADGKITRADAYVVPEGGTAFGFVTRPDPAGDVLRKVRAALAGIEGIERVVEPADYPRYGLPSPAASDQIGELVLVAKDGYAFTGAVELPVVVDATEGSLGAHGYVTSDPDIQAIFIAAGRGIASGTRLETVNTIDIAPTIARLLGLPFGPVDGRVLTDVLRVPAP